MPPQLPLHLVGQVDQLRADMDAKVSVMIEKLKSDTDLDLEGDSTYVWWALAHTWLERNEPRELATALASAMLRLVREDK